ncbi:MULTISPECIES: nuclear transport factor 2 family protein [Gilliamella]|uniref:Nuclear transport factor 2 family protein n=1 Tax=Gilliamella apicola TaxID=1196095 RepID=A0A556SBD6_9GAMM|nr:MULTISPECIES: nuclear transport factor 2 family protein [Gilliamella]MBI0095407.1 nuclear transport factor 2 family protein [Gilliamella sp. W8136]TSJ98460.1 nuclear transport factor 2 family protein [Gilliamella apicola]
MNKLLSLVLLMMLSIGSSYAVTSNNQSTVEQAVETMRLAMLSADKTQLENVALPSLTYGHSSAVIENKAEFVDAIVSGRSGFITLEFQDQTIVTEGDTAIVRHVFSADTNNSGQKGKVKIGVMLVFKKTGEDWKLLARQAYKLPQ